MAKKIFCGESRPHSPKVNIPGRPLRNRYLLLQFLTELDNSFCKMVVRGVATKLS